MTQQNLIFLKLGGSLITDKSKPLTPRLEVISQVAGEIASVLYNEPGMNLLIGHGSGSFGHAVAHEFETHKGGQSQKYWQGFARVWQAARELNQIVIEHLTGAGLPAMSFPPSSGVIASDSRIVKWDIQPLKHALAHNLIPVVQGDVIFDEIIGGTIFSTEQIFAYLAPILQPHEILLAGSDPGVYCDPQHPEKIIPKISFENKEKFLPLITGAQTTDVTGGMEDKIQWMLSLIQEIPGLRVQVFSGLETGNIQRALTGEQLGTQICL